VPRPRRRSRPAVRARGAARRGRSNLGVPSFYAGRPVSCAPLPGKLRAARNPGGL